MYTSCSESEVKTRVDAALAKDDSVPISEMAKQLQLSEGAITFALPEVMLTRIDGAHAQQILEQLPEWGNVTTIVHSCGSIFETKAPFPRGKAAHGYYNLMGREGELHGHLRLDTIVQIALVSKPFRGNESHYIGFFAQDGTCAFKIYLGRDKQRQLIPQQIEAFKQMKQEFSA
ncbi:heme utilization cystosolic carrier protein HutX [Vibrio fluminensis]|uniref:heme utilization cystosolic carrier protein HutX n=1 Tax=Vibrio fluminensis TaxID=2783614 RepID=UPI0018872B94|nr:heme utilization cystosolic carrier protein HutX [Vibrio fluminensis]